MSDWSASPSDSTPERSGFEPELGGFLRDAPERSGFEPELGGALRQKGVYVDEPTCIGCKHCSHVARNTFFIEEHYGRARVFRQDGAAAWCGHAEAARVTPVPARNGSSGCASFNGSASRTAPTSSRACNRLSRMGVGQPIHAGASPPFTGRTPVCATA